MKDNNYELFAELVAKDSFKWYNAKVKALAETYRTLADQPDVESSQRLWYLAKAQGIDEVVNLPEQWLKS